VTYKKEEDAKNAVEKLNETGGLACKRQQRV
jgi:hypothetical protein